MSASNSYPLKNVVPNSSIDTCPVKALLKYLEKIYGTVGEFLPDDRGYPKCMFFQDSFMKDLFNFYPERICIDCTFKKFEFDLYMVLFLCEDSNGVNFIVAVGFLQYNDVDSLSWLFTTFRKHNPNWRKIRSLAVDPAIEHWVLVKKMFSFSCIIICSYHAIKTFKCYINDAHVSKIVGEEQKNYAVKLFKSLLFAMTNAEFEELLQKFNSLPKILVMHFLNLWLPLKHKWRIPLDFVHEDVFKNRNEYLEELNNAIQMISESEKNYVEFIKKIFLMISFKKREKPNESLKPVSFLYSRYSPQYLICKTLTPYAAEFVIQQLDLSQEMTPDLNTPADSYAFNYLDRQVQASATSCQCNFYLYTLLPCRHMFCVRKTNSFCQYDGSDVDYTWSKQYYQHASACMDDYLTNSIDNRIPQDLVSRTALASHLFEITTPILLDLPKPVYESHMKVLNNLIEAWKAEDDVSVKFIGIDKSLKRDIHISKSSASFKRNENVLAPTSKKKCSSSKIISSDKAFQENSTFLPGKAAFKKSETAPTSNIVYSSPEILNPWSDEFLLSQEANTLQQNQASDIAVGSSNVTNPQSLVVPHEVKRASRQRLCDINHCLLNSKHINLAYIITIICLTKESCVNWLKAQGFLPTSMKCALCNGDMISKNLSRLNDGVTWRCMDKACMGKKSSIRAGTWFEESNLTLQQMLIFTYMWLNKFTKARILLEMSISAINYVKWDKFYRRVCEESVNYDSVTVVEADSSNYKDALDKWLQNQAGKDTFLEFLKDAACIYGKDKEKHSLDPKSQFNEACCVQKEVTL